MSGTKTPPTVTTVSDWKDHVYFRMASGLKDEEKLLEFVNQHFVPNEPLNVAINMCEPGYRMTFFDNFVRKYVSEGLSQLAIDKRTEKIVGVSICTECKQSPEPSDSSGESYDVGEKGQQADNLTEDGEEEPPPRFAVMPAKFGHVLEFLEQLCSSFNMFEKYKLDKYIELFILCTHSTKRYPGLGTELVHQSLAMLKEKHFSLMVTEATSFYSQKIFSKIGFQVLKEVPFEDFKPDGEIVFPKHGMHESVKLMALTF